MIVKQSFRRSILRNLSIISVLIIAFSTCSYSQKTDNTSISSDDIFGNIYADYSSSRRGSDKFILVGMSTEQMLSSKNTFFSAIYDLSIMGGFDDAKDNYLVNASLGMRLNAFGSENKFHLYWDIMSGFSGIKSPLSDKVYGGNNAKLGMGLGYNNFSIDISVMYINTSIRSFDLINLGVRYRFKI